jgi:hypothetical protein
VAEYLVEVYVEDGAALERGVERARQTAEELSREGTPVRFLRSIFVPVDDTCFFLCEAASTDLVLEVARRAQLPFDHVAEAVAGPAVAAT